LSSLETGAFYYLGSILYIILSGIVYNIALGLVSRIKINLNPRLLSLLLTVLIPVTLILLTDNLNTIMDFLFPVVASLIIYGFMVKMPDNRKEALSDI
ncbi:MAG: hypothetical protein AAFW89_09595, partial [Bacteroidota bacterium]